MTGNSRGVSLTPEPKARGLTCEAVVARDWLQDIACVQRLVPRHEICQVEDRRRAEAARGQGRAGQRAGQGWHTPGTQSNDECMCTQARQDRNVTQLTMHTNHGAWGWLFRLSFLPVLRPACLPRPRRAGRQAEAPTKGPSRGPESSEISWLIMPEERLPRIKKISVSDRSRGGCPSDAWHPDISDNPNGHFACA